ncbi:MAG TPA: hypothetical protein VIB00_13145 [Pyrinomonadaceae bacterium]|jgi:hypothetical protein
MLVSKSISKKLALVSLILLTAAVVGNVRSTGQSEPAEETKPAMVRWEYLAVAGPTTTNFTPTGNPQMRKEPPGSFAREGFVLEQHLDRMGAKGWELVSVAGPPTDPVYYFKRPK